MRGVMGVSLAAAICPTTAPMAQPRAMPISPPIRLSTDDSARNCTRISALCAPTALRRPISRVRSVTDTNMMFMMPIPPTNSEMAAIPPKKMVNTLVMVLAVLRKSCWVRMVKSSAPMAVR